MSLRDKLSRTPDHDATRAALIAARNAAVDARLARVRAEIDLARQDGRAPFQGAQ